MTSRELDKKITKNMIPVVVIYFCFLITVAIIAANLVGKEGNNSIETTTTTTTAPLPTIQTYIPC